jgi:iron(III) transport system substrate-binding protein
MPMALTVYNVAAERVKRKGAAIDWIPIKPLVGQPGAVALARRAQHPNEALPQTDEACGGCGSDRRLMTSLW